MTINEKIKNLIKDIPGCEVDVLETTREVEFRLDLPEGKVWVENGCGSIVEGCFKTKGWREHIIKELQDRVFLGIEEER